MTGPSIVRQTVKGKTMSDRLTWRRLKMASLALALAASLPGVGRAGGPHPGGWVTDLDPGIGPRPAYDAPVPGWRPGTDGESHGHDNGPRRAWLNLNSHSPFVRTGLYRYPAFGFGGYIPAGPHDDCLYVNGRGPLKR